MAHAFVRVVTIVLFLGGTLSIRCFAQSIGPDDSVLPAYSGGHAPIPTPAPPAANPPVASLPPPTPLAASAPVAPPPVPARTSEASHPQPVLATVPPPPRLIALASPTYRTLNDSEVAAAVLKGSHETPSRIGLTLIDMQTLLISGMLCKECAQSGFSVVIYTPLKWIEYQAAVAHRQLRPFSFAYVTSEMRELILRVMAYPSKADYITGTGLSMSSSVMRVVLTDGTKQDIIQPLTNEQGIVETNSALRSYNYTSASASFSLSDVDQIRGSNSTGEFFVAVVGTNQNKYFKVKTRMFKMLF